MYKVNRIDECNILKLIFKRLISILVLALIQCHWSVARSDTSRFIADITFGKVVPKYFWHEQYSGGTIEKPSIADNSHSLFLELGAPILKKHRIKMTLGFHLMYHSFNVDLNNNTKYHPIGIYHASGFSSVPIGVEWQGYKKNNLSLSVFSNIAINKLTNDLYYIYSDTIDPSKQYRVTGRYPEKSHLFTASLGLAFELKAYKDLYVFNSLSITQQMSPDKTTTSNTINRMAWMIGLRYKFMKDG